MNKVKISVIIPVYNASKYIDKCITSLLNQSFNEFEIILVNDGSDDGSLEIIKGYSEKFNNVICINQKNMGQGEARNKGIDIARGDYITFVDSDDWLSIECLQILYENIIKNNADISVCNMSKVREKDLGIEPSQLFLFDKLTGEEAIEQLLLDNKLKSYPWAKLYKKSLFIDNNVRFPARMYYEDLAAIIQVFLYTKKVVFSEHYGYFYLQTEQSSTRTPNPKNITDRLKALLMVKNSLVGANKYEVYNDKYINFCIFHLYLMLSSINKWNLNISFKKVINDVAKLIDKEIIDLDVINSTMLDDDIKRDLIIMIKNKVLYKIFWNYKRIKRKLIN